MGFGDFGSNRSVHWRTFDGDGPNQKQSGAGIDRTKRHPQDMTKSTDTPVIGDGKAPKENHPGKFRVTARYLTNASAREALSEALTRLGNGTDVLLDVPVRDIRDTPFDPPEVTVDW